MPELSPDFHRELQRLLDELRRVVDAPVLEPRLDDGTHRLRIQAGTVRVPVRYEVHWRRFRTLPTELVRDLAFAVVRWVRPEEDEADAQVFAEAFLRDAVLGWG